MLTTSPLIKDVNSSNDRTIKSVSNINSPFINPDPGIRKIVGFVRNGESFYNIFKKNNLSIDQLLNIKRVSKKFFDFKDIKPSMSYHITVHREEGDILELKYAINDMSFLSVKRDESTFLAEMCSIPYNKRSGVIMGEIGSNLIESFGKDIEFINVAFDLSDIFAWEIDFATDLRKGDKYKIIIEEVYRGNIFIGYGEILYSEFINNGIRYEGFRFAYNGNGEYFDETGKSLRKTLLRAPLKYRHISSGYSYRRKHPILKIYRPHLGIDYAAPYGTPVSSAGDGTVSFAAYKGGNGKLVVIKHPGGYKTYYGHLSLFGKGIRRGVKVTQGQIIGYVGSTGLSTGPHLDYRIKLNNRNINPLTMKLPSSKPLPAKYEEDFNAFVAEMRDTLSALNTPLLAYQK